MSSKKKTHGGARPGSGRPTAGTVTVQLRLKRETVKKLTRYVKKISSQDRYGAKSRIADSALNEYLDSKRPPWETA